MEVQIVEVSTGAANPGTVADSASHVQDNVNLEDLVNMDPTVICESFMLSLQNIYQHTAHDIQEILSKLDLVVLQSLRLTLLESLAGCFPSYKDKRPMNRIVVKTTVQDIYI